MAVIVLTAAVLILPSAGAAPAPLTRAEATAVLAVIPARYLAGTGPRRGPAGG